MQLGDKVYYAKENEIRRVALVGIITTNELQDYLSSRPDKAITRINYKVCALVDGDYKLFEVENVFPTLEELKEHILKKVMNQFTIYDN